MAIAVIGIARAQDAAEPKFASWARVENAEATKEYKEKIKEAAAFDQASRTFLVQDALPQLAREENRSSIERVRRRMREVLLTEVGNPQVLAAANGAVADFMETLARDNAADPVVRVNAAILIGELRGSDARPWADAVPRLAGLAKDPKAIMGVRVAAVAGLSRAPAALAANPQTAAAVGQAVMAILAEPAVAGRLEQDWLAGRAVGLLPALVAEYPKPVADQLVKMVTDASRSTDLRVRAAAALGAKVGPKSAVDAGPIVQAIEALATRILAADVELAEQRSFDQLYQQFVGGKVAGQGGAQPNPGFPGGGFGGAPGGFAAGQGEPSAIPDQVVRREAWRLITLAGALDGGDGAMTAGASGGAAAGKGLAGVAQGPVADKAKALATTLREAALALDADPTEQTLISSLERLRPTVKKPKPKGTGPGGEPAEAVPAGPGGDEAPGNGESPPRRPGQAFPADEPAPQPSPLETSPFG